MQTQSEQIATYYYKHFDHLPEDKQFHFVSRLSSWNQDEQAIELLNKLAPSFATETIMADLENLLTNPPAAKINAHELRAPLFAKYPELRGRMLALFRVRHLLYHYNIDVRDILLELVSLNELQTLSDALQADTQAIKILSTYAINYIYLVDEILYPTPARNLDAFATSTIALSKSYGKSAEDSLLLIYLYTHCIIGASNFYQKKILPSETSFANYKTMLDIVEQRIAENFDTINLDNKFEFLVCSKILGTTSTLNAKIVSEAESSISPNGDFVIDTINQAAQSNKTSFADSEHRNVLYIMSQREFLAK